MNKTRLLLLLLINICIISTTIAQVIRDSAAPIDTTDVPRIAIAESNPVTPQAKFKYTDIKEKVVFANGKNRVRIDADASWHATDKMKNKKNCFIVISKKDYYLYVYEAQGRDTVLLAKYDCAFGLRKGDKAKQGDMRTPHCVGLSTPNNLNLKKPFTISQILNSSAWRHDFKDGRGNILSYGKYFMRLQLNGHKVASNRSIGIHGSTNNAESVPGRASEGCIRLKDKDIIHLKENFCFVGMKVYIKAESVGDLPFERKALKKQNVSRKRHLDPKKTLSNEAVINAKVKK